MRPLPKWCLTSLRPTVYDAESGSVIEQTAKVYGAMSELIEEYNAFADTCNKKIEDFVASSTNDEETFRIALRQEFQDFIDVVELKIMEFDRYTKNEVGKQIDKIYQELKESGEFTQLFENELKKVKTTIETLNGDISNETISRENFSELMNQRIGQVNKRIDDSNQRIDKTFQDIEGVGQKIYSTMRIPPFAKIDNSYFAPFFTACAESWKKASTEGKVIYGSLSTDDTDYMAIRVNPMIYATRNDNKEFTNIYRDIWGEGKGGGTKTVNCITLCNMLAMGIPYEHSRFRGHENVIGASGYAFDVCKLIDSTIDGENVTYNARNKLDINTFQHILTQTNLFATYNKFGLVKTVKTTPDGEGDIWYDAIKPGDIMYGGNHSMFCLSVDAQADGITITYVDATSGSNPDIATHSFSVTTESSMIQKVARPYYQFYTPINSGSADFSEELTAERDYNIGKFKALRGPFTGIAKNSDLNTYTTVGEFRCATNANAVSLKNRPSGLSKGFRLTVENITGDKTTVTTDCYFRQRIVDLDGTEFTRIVYWDKTNSTVAFNSWKKVTSTDVATLT